MVGGIAFQTERREIVHFGHGGCNAAFNWCEKIMVVDWSKMRPMSKI